MTWLDAMLLGLLEGLTEFLPVSSTGHLILLGSWLGHDDEAAKTMEVVIQLGAVLAVVVYYRARLASLVRGFIAGDAASRRIVAAIAVAFMPAAVLGFLLHGHIKEHLFGAPPVGAALIVGGVVMIAIELLRRNKPQPSAAGDELEQITPKRALVIGVSQCFALWPGASRSMTSIVGGQLAGMGTPAAAEFSFLLAIPTLGAAALYDLAKGWRALAASPSGPTALVVGLVVSFVVALLVIAAFLRYLRRFGLAPFGAYRIALGALVLLLPMAAR
ncbi:undecaprenyl-diphosphate phosphatase [Polyangium aurulentum]|uniref:undecaprenyl-diphosphate phosphatase n=1 Tax=Polyangium aurulentum TaxID=2567896 RepID=UPI0010AE19FC|nr:undecaprenyl-diphosphate phosphatase [Polyangium aurulentum]UQA55366.1 undecaprenyl-diphosphate phosphatase [Polyangium aurulentum]